jgi:lipoprotein-anchoring transpeptidase ErfK/SrfK
MFQQFNSFLIKSGLVIVSILAIAPSTLHAETPPVRGQNLSPQSAKTVTPTQPKSGERLLSDPVATTAGTKPATGNNVVPSPQKPPASAVSTNSPPVMEDVQLVLNLKEKHVYVYKGDKVRTKYPVAIGKKGWETPVGEWQVMEKVENPGWTNFKTGKVIKPGPKNPLGERWIGFWTDGKDTIGFHGTPDTKSIGKAVSHGCVRMHNRDVKALFPLVKVGTIVKVVAK